MQQDVKFVGEKMEKKYTAIFGIYINNCIYVFLSLLLQIKYN